MARRCDLTGKEPMFGHNVSHSNRKTNRRFDPNLQRVTLFSEALGKPVKLEMTGSFGFVSSTCLEGEDCPP